MSGTASCSASSGPTNKTLVGALALLLVALTPPAHAQTSPGKFEITPYAGYRFGGTFEDADDGGEAELDDNVSAGLILNFRESANTQYEILYARQSTDADISEFELSRSDVELDIESLEVGGTYLGDGERWRPFMSATLGGTRISPAVGNLDSDTFWSFSLGGGIQVAPASRIGLRIEGRFRGVLLDSDTSLFCESGPEGNRCAVALTADVLWQFETFAGLVFRF